MILMKNSKLFCCKPIIKIIRICSHLMKWSGHQNFRILASGSNLFDITKDLTIDAITSLTAGKTMSWLHLLSLLLPACVIVVSHPLEVGHLSRALLPPQRRGIASHAQRGANWCQCHIMCCPSLTAKASLITCEFEVVLLTHFIALTCSFRRAF